MTVISNQSLVTLELWQVKIRVDSFELGCIIPILCNTTVVTNINLIGEYNHG